MRTVLKDASGRDAIRLRAQFATEIERLSRYGTRARGAKKLRSLDLWEIRIGACRAFFCLVPDSRLIALGAVEVKKVRKLPMARLRLIEHRVHVWRDALKEQR